MTLLDFPGHTACTVFTKGCNLRCPFCHNALLVTKQEEVSDYDEEEIFSFLKKRVGILNGVAVTGGEPLLQADIRSFIERVRSLSYKVKLDTNGFFPDKLIPLIEDGLLDYVAIDIKNSEEKYAETVGRESIDLTPLKETIAFLRKDLVPYEFRTTVVKEFHTVQDIGKIGQWISGSPLYFLQNFEDSGELIGENLHGVSREELRKMQEEARIYIPSASVRGVTL